MSTPIILLLKSLVAGYTRKDGTYVKPHSRKGGPAAKPGAGQLSLFAKPAEPAKPNPFKGKDPVKDTLPLFGDNEPVHTAPVKDMIKEHERLVDVLESPSHADDKAEAKKQRKELEEYKLEAEASPDHLLSDIPGAKWKRGKGMINGHYGVEVDGHVVGNYHAKPEDAAAEAKRMLSDRADHARKQTETRGAKDKLADRLKGGGEVSDADLALLSLRDGSSDLRWFIPAAADLFGISSRAVRPHIAEMIRVGHTDMGAKREYVSPKKALQAVAAGLSGGRAGEKPKRASQADLDHLFGKDKRVLLTKPAS